MILGGYEVGPEIGSGAMGTVHLSHDQVTGEPYALKRIHTKYAGQSQTLRRFSIEVQTAARLRHPNIVSVVASGTEPRGTPYCVMEWVSGRPLDVWARVGLPWIQVSWIVGDLLSALAFAHARGVVHRDLKPANMLVEDPHSDEPRVRLVDFGIARLLEDDGEGEAVTQLTMDDRVLGTPAYLSPEQATGQHHLIGPHTDLYAVGVIIYELISSRLPFEGLPVMQLLMAHASTPAPPLDLSQHPDVPPAVAEAVAWMLKKKPDERPQSARAVREALGLPEAVPRYPLPGVTADKPLIEAVYAPTMGGEDDPAALIETDQSGVATARSQPSVATTSGSTRGSSVQVTLQVQGSLENIDLAGRQTELYDLIGRARQARRERHSKLLLIQGEAGAGKSRLAQEARFVLEEKADFRGARLVTHGGSEAQAFRTLLARLMMAERLTGKRLSERLEAAATRYDLDPLDVRALSAWFEEAEEASAAAEEISRADLIGRVLRHVAVDQPLVMVVEGFDAEGNGFTEAVLRRVLETGAEGTVFVLAPSRSTSSGLPEGPGALYELLEAEGRADTMRLGPLSDTVIVELIAPLVTSGAEIIAQRARGNPLFAIELARFRASDTLVGNVTQATLPLSIAEIWQRRIQSVLAKAHDGELCRCLLYATAILGPAVERRRLVDLVARALSRTVDETEVALDVWIRREVLADDGGHDPTVSFLHTLGFEYVVDHIQADSRETRSLIVAIADWVVGTRAGMEPALLGRIAELLAEGDDDDRASEVRLLVGEILVGRLEYAKAQRIFEQLARLAGAQARADLEMRVAAQLANLQVLRGDVEGASGTLERYRERLETVDPAAVEPGQAPTLVGLFQAQANLAVSRGRHHRAVALLDDAVRLGKIAEDPLVLANVRTQMSQALELAGELADAERQCRLAIKRLDRVSAPARMRARAYIALASLCREQGRTEEAVEAANLARPLAEAAGDRLELDRALEVLVWLADDKGDMDRAVRLAQQIVEQQRHFGDQLGVARSTNMLGVLERHRGQLDQAERHHEHALALLERIAEGAILGAVAEHLGVIQRRRRQVEPALTHFKRALDLYEAVSDQSGVARVGAQMALALRADGAHDRAEGLARDALAMTQELHDYGGAGFAQLVVGLVVAATGRWTHAREIFSEARSVLADVGIYRDLAVAETWLSLCELRQGYGTHSTMAARRVDEKLRDRPVYKRVLAEGLLGLADAIGGSDRDLAWALENTARRVEDKLRG